MRNYRILLADDHTLIRQGLKKLIEEKSGLEVVGEAGDGLQVLDLLSHLEADLAILDISMPNMRGIETIFEIKRRHPSVSVMVLTMYKEREYLQQALFAGARGYLLKEDMKEELYLAIEKIRQGKYYVSPSLTRDLLDIFDETRTGPRKPGLTNREREILKLIAEGKSSSEIADTLSISIHTIGRHRANIKSKLSLSKTADLVRYALKEGYL